MVFQKPNPFPMMSIYDNVIASMKLTGEGKRRDLDELVERSLRGAALWEVERAARPSGPLYEDPDTPPDPSPLPPMKPSEALVADFEGAGLSLGPHAMTFHRERLERSGVARAIGGRAEVLFDSGIRRLIENAAHLAVALWAATDCITARYFSTTDQSEPNPAAAS
jgi:ABC-type sugar transport system ATPase subunit